MPKITKTGKQFRVTIPPDIVLLTGWDEKTVIHFIPDLKSPKDKLDKHTPIYIKVVKKK